MRRFWRALAVVVALALLSGCSAAADALRPDPTWVPQPEGPPPADLPQPDQTEAAPTPGPPGAPGGPEIGTADDPNVVATGLTLPWGLATLPDGTALVGERKSGRLVVVQPQRAPVRPVRTITGLDATGDGGLLGLALSPTFPQDGLVYAYLTTKTDNRVVRFALTGAVTPVLTGLPKGRTGNGGRIAFGTDGYLYVGTGDTGKPALSASRQSLAGKVLRVTTFGRPAPQNPDPASPIYSIGHGAIAGLCLNGADQVYTTEPASGTLDEVNHVERGRDYGYPGGTRAGAAGADRTVPAAAGGLSGCAVIERGLFVTSTTGKRVYAFPLDGSGRADGPTSFLIGAYGRLRTVVAGSDGALWMTTSNKDGAGKPTPQDDRVIRILPPTGSTNSPA
ncbi:MAG TPA: PQQ-dependent sugar dehydrogenase [Mycobacteriales bacterium]|nr:PQQ-dependent sugar dehydrogenase [Mycobacteriales bacterium]